MPRAGRLPWQWATGGVRRPRAMSRRQQYKCLYKCLWHGTCSAGIIIKTMKPSPARRAGGATRASRPMQPSTACQRPKPLRALSRPVSCAAGLDRRGGRGRGRCLLRWAAGGPPVKQSLRPTGVDPNAQGVAMASIHAKRDRGKFRVSGRNLKPGTTYGISVAGIRIGSLTTRATGSGAARFSSPQHGSDQFLGVDPRGKKVEVSDDQGEDVLENEMPDDGEDQGSVQCCLPDDEDDDGAECEKTTADECTAEGGTNMGTGTCFPNPCSTTSTAPDIRCCLPDDDGPECEEERAAESSASDGVNKGARSCEA